LLCGDCADGIRGARAEHVQPVVSAWFGRARQSHLQQDLRLCGRNIDIKQIDYLPAVEKFGPHVRTGQSFTVPRRKIRPFSELIRSSAGKLRAQFAGSESDGHPP